NAIARKFLCPIPRRCCRAEICRGINQAKRVNVCFVARENLVENPTAHGIRGLKCATAHSSAMPLRENGVGEGNGIRGEATGLSGHTENLSLFCKPFGGGAICVMKFRPGQERSRKGKPADLL